MDTARSLCVQGFQLCAVFASLRQMCQSMKSVNEQSGRAVEINGISIDKHSYSLQCPQTGGKSKRVY